MADLIRARRIDDLPSLVTEKDTDDLQLRINDGDKFLVSHPTNVNENGNYVGFSRNIDLNTLKEYIADYVLNSKLQQSVNEKIKIEDLADGGKIYERHIRNH